MKDPQKLKIKLSYDPAISLLGTQPKDMTTGYRKGICTPMLVAALLAIANI